MTTPTQRTLALLRKEGWTAVVVERWNAFARKRFDVFGGDILAIRENSSGPLLVQCTARSSQSARWKKVIALPCLRVWLLCHGQFEVWGWAKVGARGKRKTWQVTRRTVTLGDLQPDEPKP